MQRLTDMLSGFGQQVPGPLPSSNPLQGLPKADPCFRAQPISSKDTTA